MGAVAIGECIGWRRSESSEAIRRTAHHPRAVGKSAEEMVRPPWRHGEPGGTETTWPPVPMGLGVTDVSVPIRRARRRLEEGCPQYERTGTDGPLVCQLSRQRHGWLATSGRDKR